MRREREVRQAVCLLMVAALAAVLAGCGGAAGLDEVDCDSLAPVPNPDYRAWSDFAPGSYVTMECRQSTGEKTSRVRITERLIARSDEVLVLRRTVTPLDGDEAGKAQKVRRQEPRTIGPCDDPRTHPRARVRDHGTSVMEIRGTRHVCRVESLELCARCDGLSEQVADISTRTWFSPEIPGRVAKIRMTSTTGNHEFRTEGAVVDYKAVPREEGPGEAGERRE